MGDRFPLSIIIRDEYRISGRGGGVTVVYLNAVHVCAGAQRFFPLYEVSPPPKKKGGGGGELVYPRTPPPGSALDYT